MGKRCRIFQVVGYKNAGKTTLMEQLIAVLRNEGMGVSCLKHHGHGGAPAGSTDSDRFLLAGANGSSVEGDGVLKIVAKKREWTLAQLLQLQVLIDQPDVILVEGWKNAPYPKVVLLCDDGDWPLLELEQVQCAIDWGNNKEKRAFPVFGINEHQRYIPYLKKQILESGAYF
ncbi:molybdopterin-guanine dinucleotide biosynthesis protein B [Shouchella tritolerans]|uniref:molybdopterin-guanine dinucleotide biosynthesis protein B n=1 Tax=Shouchella tritolerans TaxID=2979466 RepID=UPI0021E7BE26|nr:molybdopterin-guanine dinucleotide biosynthesis protein B [Shouchella tritolerans]